MGVIDEVKQRVDIIEVISQYATLTKAGRNFRALCPFHSEKRPSFFVYPEQQSWHCFGACNTGGDVFSFIMKKENIDFGEALRLLAQRVGVTIPSRFEPDAGKDERARIYQINEAATQYFHNLLLNSPAGEKARDYLTSRGFSPKTMSDFQLGFGLNNWEALTKYLMERGYTEGELLEAGLLVTADDGKTHDRFRNKLMFPISDARGHVIGFGARVLDESLPKYVNSPQTPVFDKSSNLYGINLATPSIRQNNMVVIVEGYMDVITAHQNGFTNVVASMGTAVTEKQIQSLKKLTRNITLALDSDIAGKEATKRGGEIAIQPSEQDLGDISENNNKMIISLLNEGEIRKRRIFGSKYINQNVLDTEVSILILPSGQDPDDVIKEDAEKWRQLVEGAIPILDYIFDMVTSTLDLTKAKDKSIVVENLLPIVNQIIDPVHHAHYIQKLARLVQMNTRDLEAALSSVKPKVKTQQPKAEVVARAVKPLRSSPLEEYCLALLLQHPELRDRSDEIIPEYFENSENREIFNIWRQVNAPSSLRDNLDSAVWEHLDTLINKNLSASQIEQRYTDCVLNLRKKYHQNREAQRAEVLALEAEVGGTAAGLAKLEEGGIEDSIQLGEVFAQKARKDQNQRR